MACLRVFLPRRGEIRILVVQHDGRVRYLDSKSKFIINSSGIRVFGVDGNVAFEMSWVPDDRFREWTSEVSTFLIEDGKLFVKNTLQELVCKSNWDGKVYGGAPGYQETEEVDKYCSIDTTRWTPSIHGQSSELFHQSMMTLACGLQRLGLTIDPIVIEEAISGNHETGQSEDGIFFDTTEVHYTEWKQVGPGLLREFQNATFVFNESGLQIHQGNVLIIPPYAIQPIHCETWSQEVSYTDIVEYAFPGISKISGILKTLHNDVEQHYVRIHNQITLFEMSAMHYSEMSPEEEKHMSDTDKKKRANVFDTLTILHDYLGNIIVEGKVYSDVEERWERIERGLEEM